MCSMFRVLGLYLCMLFLQFVTVIISWHIQINYCSTYDEADLVDGCPEIGLHETKMTLDRSLGNSIGSWNRITFLAINL